MASNATTVADANNAYSDYIELYNKNSYEVDLSGYGISDSLSQPKKYTLPEGTVIAPGGYLVIFCSGNEGFNVATGEYVDMIKAGILDPAKVTRSALQNAASVASLLLTTECLITDINEEKEPAMPQPGMGGMGGMM